MVDYQAHLDTTFAALADTTRRSILARLAREELTVSEVARPYEMSLAAVSKHLQVLSKAGLVEQQRNGRLRRCRLTPEPLREAADWIETYRQFWIDSFDKLAEHLEEVQRTPPPRNTKPETKEND